MELDYKAIGKRIKIARIKKNLTQETVADRIGVTPQHVSNIETGNTSVSLTTLVAIANTLTVSVEYSVASEPLNPLQRAIHSE